MPKPSETAEVGTKESGFAKGEIWGPFKCGACRHAHKSNGGLVCTHPSVISDHSADLRARDAEGRPFVDAEDCCRYQRKTGNLQKDDVRSQAQKSGMRG